MKVEQLKALISYRIQQSKETLHEAEILYNEKSFRGTINRAYYALDDAQKFIGEVQAYLISEGYLK